MFLEILVFTATVISVLADTCYKTSGSYVYHTYCSGYCSGSYGQEICTHYYYSYYTYYYSVVDDISSAAIAGIVIGSLFGLAVLIAITVVIIKSCTASGGSHGRIVATNPGQTTTVAYTTGSEQYGTALNYNPENSGHVGQQSQNHQGQYMNAAYPPTAGYPPVNTHNASLPPPYPGVNYGGLTPIDSKNINV